MGKLRSAQSPKEIVYGAVTSIGARRIRVLINGTKEVFAKCEDEHVDKLSIGTNVVIGYLDSNMDAYVVSVSTDILGGATHAIVST